MTFIKRPTDTCCVTLLQTTNLGNRFAGSPVNIMATGSYVDGYVEGTEWQRLSPDNGIDYTIDGKFTVQRSGIFEITFNATPRSTAATLYNLWLRRNGNDISQANLNVRNNLEPADDTSQWIVSASAGDEFEVVSNVSAGATSLNFEQGTCMTMMRIADLETE